MERGGRHQGSGPPGESVFAGTIVCLGCGYFNKQWTPEFIKPSRSVSGKLNTFLGSERLAIFGTLQSVYMEANPKPHALFGSFPKQGDPNIAPKYYSPYSKDPKKVPLNPEPLNP